MAFVAASEFFMSAMARHPGPRDLPTGGRPPGRTMGRVELCLDAYLPLSFIAPTILDQVGLCDMVASLL